MSTPSPTPICLVNPECERRFAGLERRTDAHSERLRVAEVGLGKLQAQVALAAGVGAIVGSGLAALLARIAAP